MTNRECSGRESPSFGAAVRRGAARAFKAFWTVYQLALGAVLLMLFLLFVQLWNAFHVGDIRALRHKPPETTAFIEAARAANPGLRVRKTWIPLDSIPRTLVRLALVAEDAKFYSHHGFDLEQIEYALVANHQAGRKMRGASTITQQTAKNLYLGGEKELSRKLHEAVLALLLEQILSKDRILEVYLNIAQFGPGVYGVREGARHHFGRDVRALSQDQMLSLVALLPAPKRWDPDRPSGAYLTHRNRVARNFGLLRAIGEPAASGEPAADDAAALDSLGDLLSDEAWGALRTGPDPVTVDAAADSGENREEQPTDGVEGGGSSATGEADEGNPKAD